MARELLEHLELEGSHAAPSTADVAHEWLPRAAVVARATARVQRHAFPGERKRVRLGPASQDGELEGVATAPPSARGFGDELRRLARHDRHRERGIAAEMAEALAGLDGAELDAVPALLLRHR